MRRFKDIFGFITRWKKSFIGGIVAFLISVIGLSSGIIRIWEKAEEIMHVENAKIEKPRIPIHDHVTFEINKLTRKLEREGVIYKKNITVLKNDTLRIYRHINRSNVIKQIPNKK